MILPRLKEVTKQVKHTTTITEKKNSKPADRYYHIHFKKVVRQQERLKTQTELV